MNIEITKQINLDNNDGLSSVFGLAAQQHHEAYQVFYDFIKENEPARILEIGTALGGFTQFLKRCVVSLGLNTDIRSYDIHEMRWYKDMISQGIDVRVENIFSPDYSTCDPEVIEYIKQPGATVILCDGGDKIREFRLLANYVRVGDFIMAHDYAHSIDVFNATVNRKRWNWCEITLSDIQSSVYANDLIGYNYHKFENVAWTCMTKL